MSNEQAWQKLRRQVQQHSDPEATKQAYDNANDHADAKNMTHERRIGKLEERQSVLESRTNSREESISAMLELMQRELVLLVTRPEFDHIRWIVYGISLSMITGGTFAIIFKAVGK